MHYFRRKTDHLHFYIYNTRIELVDSFKYLGVHLFKNNRWNRTQKMIASHAASSLHNLFITFNQPDLNTRSQITHHVYGVTVVQKKVKQFTQTSAEKSYMLRTI